ncbi:ATP-dependent helicase HrpB [Alteromonas sp. a30]|uniref:ATP-dependent helicase HrpB n=1 Tax=Alteromonas sp. a30 TaxID=2730917 RepID=UPI00227E8EA3|nr:ATP-dependent helicase HrpB [Alteromonas sp. a30]MCY7297220.1 ATP-dependent helicase HrpB [Alteromonas sp. a30]
MLPINDHLARIVSLLNQHSSLVLQAEPGAGKSTAVPLHLLKANIAQDKKIVMLEPRRVAARSIATFLAQQCNQHVGESIGYQIRNERKTSPQTKLEIVTEGVLTRRLQADPELNDIGLIIFDEFHERSIHADLALMLALETQDAYRDNLKLLVMSATIDTDLVSGYLNQAPVLTCPGRTFPVTTDYAGKPTGSLVEHVMRQLSAHLQRNTSGDVLVFLPGQADIKRCLQEAEALPFEGVDYFALYGGLPLSAQTKVLSRENDNRQRVIFATNIAETSLTIEGITCVIDSGLEKVLNFDVKSGLTRLETSPISKASATQRAGRAGRLQAGTCIRLWGESEQRSLNDFQPEEITNSDLSDLVLELSAWGINRYHEAHWLTAPPEHHFDIAVALNRRLGLVDTHNKITPLGKAAISLGLSPRLASMLLRCKTDKEKKLACMLAALVSERDIFIHSRHADITDRLLVLHEYLLNRANIKADRRVHKNTLEQVRSNAIALAQKVDIALDSVTTPESLRLSLSDMQSLSGPILFKAFPDRLAKSRRQSDSNSKYLLANGRGVALREEDPLIGHTWLLVCDCDGKNKDGMIFSCAPLCSQQISSLLENQTTESTHYQLDAKKEQIHGNKETRYQAIVLQQTRINNVPKSEFTQCVVDILQTEGLSFLNWTPKCAQWLARAQWLSQHIHDFPALSETSLLATLDNWLLPYITQVESIKQLKQVNVFDLIQHHLSWEQQQCLAKEAPEHYVTPQGKRIPIRYDEHQGPTVSVILQQMFGQTQPVRIAQNQVALRFELLSPARRPIQTTSDLANFWQTSYIEIAKEMRGRYPKHNWDPS